MMKQDIKLKGSAPQSVFQVPHSLLSLMVWYNIASYHTATHYTRVCNRNAGPRSVSEYALFKTVYERYI